MLFQICQKIVVMKGDKVLLCRRRGEADFDGTYSFIGGKLEHRDGSIINGLKREKDEEVGKDFRIRVYTDYCINVYFRKKDGHHMILPHYCAEYVEGDIDLSDEYDDFRWVDVKELEDFEPKIPNIPEMVDRFMRIRQERSEVI